MLQATVIFCPVNMQTEVLSLPGAARVFKLLIPAKMGNFLHNNATLLKLWIAVN